MTFDAAGNQIEYCTTLSLTVSTPATITNAGFFCQNNNINTNDQCQITFLTVTAHSAGSTIRLQFPAEMSLNLLSSNGVVGQTGVKLGPLTYSTIGSNIVLISDGFDSYKGASTNCTMVLRFIQLPSTTATTSSFVVNTETSTGALVSKISSGLTYQALPGKISAITITATDPTVAATTTFKFLFTPTGSLAATGGIQITFPVELPIANQPSGACASGDTPSVNPTPLCSVSSQVLTVSGLFSGPYTGGTQIGFTVNLVTNPSSTKPTSTFIIQTYSDISSSATLTDRDTAVTYAATNYALLDSTAITIVPSSFTVSTLTTYTFTFKNKNILFSSGTILIEIPPTVTIPNPTNAKDSFAIGSSLAATATVAVTSTTIEITNAVSSNLAAGSTISFSLTGIQNPPTLQPSASFTIITKTSDGYLIDGINSAVTVTMTSVPTFYHIQIIPNNYYNSAVTQYRFEITVRNQHFTGDYVEITFPTDIQFPNVPVCNPITNLLAFTTVCVKTGQKLVVTPNFNPSTLPIQTVFIFTVPGCTNPLSEEPFASFQIASFSSANYKREETLTGVVFTSLPNPIKTISIVPLEDIPGVSTDYTLEFEPVTPIPSTGTIKVRVPTEIQVTEPVECTFNEGILGSSASCAYSSTTRMITLSDGGPFSGSTINFTFSGLTNPSTGKSSTFEVYTYTANGYIIDQNTSNLFYQAFCSSPCRTCLSTDSSNCTSCFTNATTTKIYLYNGTCLTECPSVAPPDSSNVCTPCGTACSACDTTGACTTCNSSSYQLVNGTCEPLNQFGIQVLQTILANGGAPFPFLISAGSLFLFILIMSLAFKRMTFTSNLLAFYGLLEYFAILTFLIMLCKARNWSFSISTSSEDVDFMFALVALILNYFLNFGLVLYYFLKIRADPGFVDWLKESGNTCCPEVVLVLATITSLKFFPLFYGRFFDFKLFSARCSSTSVLFPLSMLMGFHGLFAGGALVASAALHLINAGFLPDQSTITSIEIPIIVILTFIVFLFEIRKPDDYFNPISAEMEKYLKVDEESKIGLAAALKAAQIEKLEREKKEEKAESTPKKTQQTGNAQSQKKGLPKETSLAIEEIPEPEKLSGVLDTALIRRTPSLKTSTRKPKRILEIQHQDMITIGEKKPAKVSEMFNSNHDDIPTLRKGFTRPIDEKATPISNESANESRLQLLNKSSLNDVDIEELEEEEGQRSLSRDTKTQARHQAIQTDDLEGRSNAQGRNRGNEKQQEQRPQVKQESERIIPSSRGQGRDLNKDPTRELRKPESTHLNSKHPPPKKQKTDQEQQTGRYQRKETASAQYQSSRGLSH